MEFLLAQSVVTNRSSVNRYDNIPCIKQKSFTTTTTKTL